MGRYKLFNNYLLNSSLASPFEVLQEMICLGFDDDKLLVPALFHLGSEWGQRMRRENDASMTQGNIVRMIEMTHLLRKLRGHNYNIYECCFLAISDADKEAGLLCVAAFSLIAQILLLIILMYYNMRDITNGVTLSEDWGTIVVVVITTQFFTKLVYAEWKEASDFNAVFWKAGVRKGGVNRRLRKTLLWINIFVNGGLGIVIALFNIFFLLISEDVNEAILNSLALFFILEIDDTLTPDWDKVYFDSRIALNIFHYITVGDGGGGVDFKVDIARSHDWVERQFNSLLESDFKVYLEVDPFLPDAFFVYVRWRWRSDNGGFKGPGHDGFQFRIWGGADVGRFYQLIKEFYCVKIQEQAADALTELEMGQKELAVLSDGKEKDDEEGGDNGGILGLGLGGAPNDGDDDDDDCGSTCNRVITVEECLKHDYPLRYACWKGASFDVIKYLVEADDDKGKELLGKADDDGRYPLHLALEGGASLKVIKYLVEADGNKGKELLGKADNNGRYPLHLALEGGASLKVIKYLVEADGNKGKELLGKADNDGMYPLHLACQRGTSLDAIKYLVEADDDKGKEVLGKADNDGRYPLHLALRGGASLKVIKYLVLVEADDDKGKELLGKADNDGRYPLHLALRGGASLDVIKYLVEGADGDKGKEVLGKADILGRYPLHWACYEGASLNVIKYLVEKVDGDKGKEVLGKADNDGKYALHWACWRCASFDVIKYLVEEADGDKGKELLGKADKNDNYPLDLLQDDSRHGQDSRVDVIKYFNDNEREGERGATVPDEFWARVPDEWWEYHAGHITLGQAKMVHKMRVPDEWWVPCDVESFDC